MGGVMRVPEPPAEALTRSAGAFIMVRSSADDVMGRGRAPGREVRKVPPSVGKFPTVQLHRPFVLGRFFR
jgi:hypothetical protein